MFDPKISDLVATNKAGDTPTYGKKIPGFIYILSLPTKEVALGHQVLLAGLCA